MITGASSPSVKRVLVAVDLDAVSHEALHLADRVARGLDAALGVVNVLPPGLPEHAVTPHRSSTEHEEHAEETTRKERVTAYVARETSRGPSQVEVFADRGNADEAILERAARFGADLVVVGTHGRHGLDRLIEGSVAELVVRRASIPVLVARPSPEGGKVLAACDLAATTPAVLRWAGLMSGRVGDGVLAVHTVELSMSDVAVVATAIFSGTVPVQPDSEAADSLRTAATGALGAEITAAEIVATPEVLTGPAASVLCERARDLGASLLVVGTHGRKGIARVALGSVAETLVRNAPSSVLVVR